MCNKVYLLWHTHPAGPNEANEKLIGLYSTEADAGEAQKRLSMAPGFSSHLEGFEMVAYEVGVDHWTEGYFTD